MAERKTVKVDPVLARLRLELRLGPADDGDVMAALAQSGRGLEHLVNRARVELVELEDLEDLHRKRAAHCNTGF